MLITNEHFKPKPINDSLSVYIFDSFIDALDPERNIFLKSEYDTLSKYRFLLDNYILDNDCSFFGDFVTTYKTALLRNKKIIENLKLENFDYSHTRDTIRFTREQLSFYLKNTTIEKTWRKRICYDILEDMSKMNPKYRSLKNQFSHFEKISRGKIFEMHLCRINSILENEEMKNKLQNSFYNIYCSYFDPHTSYFSSDEKSSFFSSLSTDNYSVGLYVSLNENEEIIVDEIVPGSPAAATKKVDKGDQLIKVANIFGDSYWVSCVSMKTIADLVFSDNYKEIELTLRKKNGTIYTINVKKQIMKAEEHSVYSFVLEKESRVGYIKIPSFYSDFDGDNIRGVSDDVEKEVAKLKKDKIEGLIIDLQSNGGGSMDEAIKLSSMFIDIGPLSVLVDNRNKKTILRDYSRGTIYNGPIIVMINGFTASASEFFAAVMKDYNRALIVGNTSLGKATMQTILPLEENDDQNFVKVTIEKFYRITGKSHQKIGIEPQITFPSLFNNIISRENSYKTALDNDEINVNTRYIKYSNTIQNMVIQRSEERNSKNKLFKEINKTNTEINTFYNTPKPPLLINLKNVFQYVHSSDKLWKEINMLNDRENTLTILNNSVDQKALQYEENFDKDINQYKIKSLKTNPYLEEIVNIIKDYNELKRNY